LNFHLNLLKDFENFKKLGQGDPITSSFT
jgi:hypothetical protein